jgi:hypothetical protein
MKYPLKKELVDGLITKYGYPKSGATLVSSKLLHLQRPINSMFRDWWLFGEKPNVDIEGYTFESLMELHNMNPIAAFLTLDWLMREPERAKESLKHGYDFIETDSESKLKK